MPVKDLLPKLDALTNELRKTNSILEKKRIILEHPETHHFLRCLYTSGPLYITSKSIDKEISSGDESLSIEFIEDLMERLSTRSLSGHAAIKQVQSLIQLHPGYTQLIKDIIDKDLRIRMGPKLILDSIGTNSEKIPVALAEDWKDEKIRDVLEKSLEKNETWFASRKLDGVRCLAIIENIGGKVEVSLRSRQGKSLDRLELIRTEVSALQYPFEGKLVLDGELCCFDRTEVDLDSAKENFRKAAGQVGRLETCPTEKLTFVVFDMLKYEELNGTGRTLSERLEGLYRLKTHSHVKILPQTKLRTKEDFESALAKSRQYGWEGLMVRKDAPYLGRRSRDLIKCKDFIDSEFLVIDYRISPIRTIINGTETTVDLLSSITVEYKGSRVDVGSGFSMDERRLFKEMGDALIGRQVTICYFEESSNKVDGKPSLRFPIFKSLHNPL